MDAGTFLIILSVSILALALTPLGLWRWGLWVAERHPGRSWRIAARLPLAGFAFVIAGYTLGAAILARAYEATRGSGAADKATLLSNGLSEALNCAAFVALPVFPICALAALAFTVGSVRRSAHSR